jgi:hypothetical protein
VALVKRREDGHASDTTGVQSLGGGALASHPRAIDVSLAVAPTIASIDQERQEKDVLLLREAKTFVKAKQYGEAKRVLREIIDEGPLTNASIEARRTLKSLPRTD